MIKKNDFEKYASMEFKLDLRGFSLFRGGFSVSICKQAIN
jgi:hypothetical protein